MYLVLRPLPCQVEEQLRPLHCPTLLEVRTVVVGEAGGGENGDHLAARDGVHSVDEGDSDMEHGLGVVAGGGVDGHDVDVEVGLGQHHGEEATTLPGMLKTWLECWVPLPRFRFTIHAVHIYDRLGNNLDGAKEMGRDMTREWAMQ